ncbi:hypothetical protein CR161_09030 [Prosthecochloris sp. ZM]|uniref:hypothetical protein n=1 Tax=unclassified Prosthecochloris TaxID=2632826 RepID=UPI000DF73AF4|nr:MULTISPECIES: hypothetical protein [unclassified Prosthecochloris]NEX12617.1 hypothetical protein [Prosthecochloris sp.]RDD30828.1 hypothetical protein CR161_09030 [Prosthecochloris sp. ZM]
MKSSAKNSKTKKAAPKPMPLEKTNYIFLGIGIAIIAFGYSGMALENSVDGLFSLTISPVLLVGAYAWIIFALLYRKQKK